MIIRRRHCTNPLDEDYSFVTADRQQVECVSPGRTAGFMAGKHSREKNAILT